MYGSRLDTTITWASGSSSARIRRTVAGVHFTSAALAEFPFFSNSRRSLRSGSAGGSFSTTRRRLRRTEASTAAIEKTKLVITKAHRAEVEEKNPRFSPVMRVTRRFCTRRPIIVLKRDRGHCRYVSANVSERLGFRFSRLHDQRNQALVAVGQKRRDAFADPLEEKIDRLVADRQVPYRDAVDAHR